VLSDKTIGSPVINTPSHLLVMNRPSLEKFAPRMKQGGVCVVNSSLIPIESERRDIDQVRIPCNDLAIKLGNARMASIIALGAFCARSNIVDFEMVRAAVRYSFSEKPKLIDSNLNALEEGATLARSGGEPFSPAPAQA